MKTEAQEQREIELPEVRRLKIAYYWLIGIAIACIATGLLLLFLH